MGIFIDIVLIAILALSVLMGYKKGLINVIFNVFALLLAIVITLIFYRPLSHIIINNTQIDDKIKEVIINNNLDSQDTTTTENNNSTSIQKYIQDKIDDTTKETKQEVTHLVADAISYKAIEVITAILLFVITRILIIFLKFLTEAMAELPLVKQFNKTGGVLYGVIRGVIIIYVLITVMFLIISLSANNTLSDIIDSSYVTKFLYENNIITKTLF